MIRPINKTINVIFSSFCISRTDLHRVLSFDLMITDKVYDKTVRKEISGKNLKRSNIYGTAAYIITDRHNDRSGFRGNFDFS